MGRELLLVAAGGALGAMGRFVLSQVIYGALGRGFPYGTFAVNLIGSTLIGLAYVVLVEQAPGHATGKALLIAGVLGAFTTYSSFALDSILLMQSGQPVKAAVYVLSSTLLCLLGAWAGLLVARQFI
ncbi:fluoride efflux transporter CrcB [Alkalilimnicola sp. S0819]|uniref:fluoride efflux transporter CrcB n=1 Tax=Alkalilimnicola sp. S0819 TaxID=2613922 RepID=UPI001262AC00|nr:fluoride efflux transporter CrcB [Alkalilimnicola sp. S0819]KAB7627520.1 fluoride efflux transporter CrcB [Alkalilimnicola sp. S0819]MPQ15674.1 fluoride efflux transporter CrcB [Alkalilimnicola sp. S0819]